MTKIITKHGSGEPLPSDLDVAEIALDEGTGDLYTKLNTNQIKKLNEAESYDDTQLRADLDAETQARVDGDADLQGQLDAETQARIDGDTALDLRIDAVEGSITDGGGFVEAPNDGKLYGRQSEAWAEVVIPDDADDYDDTQIKADLATETQARIDGDAALQVQIDDLEPYDDKAITDALAAETQARIDGDVALGDAVDAEKNSRINADNQLQTQIDSLEPYDDKAITDALAAETQARVEADDKLQDEIDKKVEEAPTSGLVYGRANGTWVEVTGGSGGGTGGAGSVNLAYDKLTPDGVKDTFDLTLGGEAREPIGATNLLVSVNGVIQEPGVAFTTADSTITFAEVPQTDDVIDFIVELTNGSYWELNGVNLEYAGDGTKVVVDQFQANGDAVFNGKVGIGVIPVTFDLSAKEQLAEWKTKAKKASWPIVTDGAFEQEPTIEMVQEFVERVAHSGKLQVEGGASINGQLLASQPDAGVNAFAAGAGAGSTAQGENTVAVGLLAGRTNQGLDSIAVGKYSGYNAQGPYSVAIGASSGNITQGTFSTAIGNSAGYDTQGESATAVGNYAGNDSQGANAVAVGNTAGQTSQGASSVAIGNSSGVSDQGANAVAVGTQAGQVTQGANATALGFYAGNNNQSPSGVAIGGSAGRTNQGDSSVSIGNAAGYDSQGLQAVAIGKEAGKTTQGDNSVAIGNAAGNNNQGDSATAVGNSAGSNTQGANSVAVGTSSGREGQNNYATAVGGGAGATNQGKNAVAVGYKAGNTSQGANGIIISSFGSEVNDTSAGHIIIKSSTQDLRSLPAGGFAMNGDPIVGTRGLISTLSTLRNATKDETTLEGMRDALSDAIGGLIEKFEHEIATMPAPEVSTMPAGEES
jgi:hypothetical protein